MSNHDGLLCYSRGKLCLLNMFLASVDTLDASFARYGRILWHNVNSWAQTVMSFMYVALFVDFSKISNFFPSGVTLSNKIVP